MDKHFHNIYKSYLEAAKCVCRRTALLWAMADPCVAAVQRRDVVMGAMTMHSGVMRYARRDCLAHSLPYEKWKMKKQ